jgi:hypothetical protein
MILNSVTIEDLVFRNSSVTNKLPHHKDHFQQWNLGQMVPALRSMGQKAKLDLLNTLSEEDLKIIEACLDLTLTIEKIDYCTLKDYTFDIENAENFVNGDGVMLNDFCLSRDGDRVYLCTWR